LPPPTSAAGERIRVAYLSADFYDHATTCLIAGLFEEHDRARFAITALSYGPQRDDLMQRRVRAACERFIDVRAQSDEQIAALLRELEIDIVVDLKGYTGDARPGILVQRAAPVQITYLGYPGTLGVPLADYVIADRVLVTDQDFAHYGEKVIRMPDSYQVNDDRRPRIELGEAPPRAELGLPDDAFVFCAFNSSYKITPAMFAIWLRVLRSVAGSVLWLYRSNEAMVENLRAAAARHGVDPERLVFAPRVSMADNIRRQQRADLFLDTQPCSAHTTASDALRAGLPLITCPGATFASRVAASLMYAAGMPELVTGSLADYESLALRLATDRAALAQTRARVAHNVRTGPLFDTGRFCRHLQDVYVAVLARWQQGLPPAHFDVADGAWR
jgi:predicted O-linked N-acetylglucosamine transferase (SPINDLY family)